MRTPEEAAVLRVSVVVRSMNRLPALAELLERLLAQQHDSFEVVVVDQTTEAEMADRARVEALTADPRVNLLSRPPLGGPGARNEGVRAARGDLVLLIDDDDLPVGNDWIAAHEAHYADPNLVGLTARHVRAEGEAVPYLRPLRPLLQRLVMGYSVLKTPYTFARFDVDRDGVGWLHGTNASVRREVALRAGLWDTTVRSQDEHSFAFKLQRVLRPGEYLGFRAYPPVQRRMDIAGGMAKRRVSPESELENHLRYVHQNVRRYFPQRFRWAYPFYLGWALGRTFNWAWSDVRPRPSLAGRLRLIGEAVRRFPSAVARVRSEAREA